MADDNVVRMNEYTKEEWWDVVRTINKEIDYNAFEQMWETFTQLKLGRAKARKTN